VGAEEPGHPRRTPPSAVLGQLDDVAIVIAVPCRPPPGLQTWTVDDVCTSIYCPLVCRVDISDSERDLRARRVLPVLALVERKVDECSLGPTRCGVTATDPAVVPLVIVEVKVKGEAVRV